MTRRPIYIVRFAPGITITGNPPNGTVGEAYSAQLGAVGGTPPYTFELLSKPSWASINGSTGEITGTPDADGDATFEAQVTDALGATATREFTIAITTDAYDDLIINTQGPYAYYLLNETSGTTAADSSGNNRHATYVGANLLLNQGSLFSDGSGASVHFNPNNDDTDYLDTGEHLKPLGSRMATHGVTFTCVINTSDVQQNALLGVLNDDLTTALWFHINRGLAGDAGNAFLAVRSESSDRCYRDLHGDFQPITDGSSKHIAVRANDFDVLTEAQIFVNGALADGMTDDDMGGGDTTVDFAYAVTMFAQNTRGTMARFLNSKGQRAAWFDRALSDAEILAQAQTGGFAE